jgi:hypothetical protein
MNDTIVSERLSPAAAGGKTGGRAICDALHLFRICPHTRCQRSGACRGSPQTCIHRHGRIVPEEVWDWVAGILEAKEDGLTVEATMEAIEPFAPSYLA